MSRWVAVGRGATGNVWRLYQGYDANHRITAQDYDKTALSPFDLTQSFDSLGRVRNRTSPKGGSFTRRVFRYDSLGFLRNACDSTGSQCQNTVNAGTSHDSVGSIVCRIIGTCPGGAGSGVKYGWDALGRLRVVKDGYSGAVVDSFYYDPQGRRVKKKKATGGTEYYVYEGSQVILDVDSTGAVLREYAWFPGEIDRLLALRTPTDTFAAVLDPGNGSVRGLARFRTGGNVKEYAELPWGDTAADTGFTVRYRFAGREFDQETGLYYMRARYYDPTMGRWISEDPIGVAGGLNLYRYASNDPLNRVDHSGLGDDPGCLDTPQGCPVILPDIDVTVDCPHGLIFTGWACDDPFGTGAWWGLPIEDFGDGSSGPGFGAAGYQPDQGTATMPGKAQCDSPALSQSGLRIQARRLHDKSVESGVEESGHVYRNQAGHLYAVRDPDVAGHTRTFSTVGQPMVPRGSSYFGTIHTHPANGGLGGDRTFSLSDRANYYKVVASPDSLYLIDRGVMGADVIAACAY